MGVPCPSSAPSEAGAKAEPAAVSGEIAKLSDMMGQMFAAMQQQQVTITTLSTSTRALQDRFAVLQEQGAQQQPQAPPEAPAGKKSRQGDGVDADSMDTSETEEQIAARSILDQSALNASRLAFVASPVPENPFVPAQAAQAPQQTPFQAADAQPR